MTRLIPVCASVFVITACATSSAPTTPDTSAAPDPAPAEAVAESVAEASTTDGVIDVVEVPAVAKAEPEPDPRKDERICRREVRTGTHRAVRVCRTRAEIERIEQESKDAFRDLHQSQRTQDMAESGKRL